MSENYYDSLINHINALINSNELEKARNLIDEELSMPFVPRDTLSKLNEYSDYISGQLMEEKGTRIMSPSEVYDSLKSQSEKSYKALETLAMSNIRNYLDVIKDLLVDEQVNHLLKALLIEQLSMQQVNDIVQFVENGQILNVMPSAIPNAIGQKNYTEVEKHLERIIRANPTFLTQCRMVLANVAYDRYPRQIEDGEVELITYSIIRYVFLAYDDTQGLRKFINDYKIDENQLEEYSF